MPKPTKCCLLLKRKQCQKDNAKDIWQQAVADTDTDTAIDMD